MRSARLPSAHHIGLRGEAYVAGVVRSRGWRIDGQRLRTPAGEADIFATRGAVVDGGRHHYDRIQTRTQARVGLVIEVKAAVDRWPSADLVPRSRQARLWRVATLLTERADLAEMMVVIALVRLDRNSTRARWIALEAW